MVEGKNCGRYTPSSGILPRGMDEDDIFASPMDATAYDLEQDVAMDTLDTPSVSESSKSIQGSNEKAKNKRKRFIKGSNIYRISQSSEHVVTASETLALESIKSLHYSGENCFKVLNATNTILFKSPLYMTSLKLFTKAIHRALFMCIDDHDLRRMYVENAFETPPSTCSSYLKFEARSNATSPTRLSSPRP